MLGQRVPSLFQGPDTDRFMVLPTGAVRADPSAAVAHRVWHPKPLDAVDVIALFVRLGGQNFVNADLRGNTGVHEVLQGGVCGGRNEYASLAVARQSSQGAAPSAEVRAPDPIVVLGAGQLRIMLQIIQFPQRYSTRPWQ